MSTNAPRTPLLEREDLNITPQYNTFADSSQLESQDKKPTVIISEVSLLLPDIHSKLHHEDEPEILIWHHEAKTILQYATPMCLTLLLQYSLTISSILVVGHLGKEELGAVSLANMTAIITGYAVYQGFASSLDTLCPQAYGSGRLKLVGLHMQRLTLLLLLVTVPIGIIWLQSHRLFMAILPKGDQKIALLAGKYLSVALIGAPGFALFEAGKRYAQAQGLFYASLQVLLVCAPVNAFMSWYFVWKLNWGFIGAPIAVAITQISLPILLALNIKLGTRHLPSCWHPVFTRSLITGWWPMLRLAIPGMLNIESEFIAWEVLTLISSYLGATALAAQSALYCIVCLAYMLSFATSIGSSTRLAILVGAGQIQRVKLAKQVALCIAVCMGLFNAVILLLFRKQLPLIFTEDIEVAFVMQKLLPLCAALQVFDTLNTTSNGILRAAGRPALGSYVQLACYYMVGLPLGMSLAFNAGWGLEGIWLGMVIAMVLIGVVMVIVAQRVDWEKAVVEAEARIATTI